ncbi:MAG: hypothetical protein PHE02_12705 [Lachnospiraceae bacterium]|nr:hypothetical protein [Lachnospiraceae bacterium]
MKKRESVLTNLTPAEEEVPIPKSHFTLRLCVALLLFTGFMWLDLNQATIGNIDSTTILSSITENFQSNLFDFMDFIPYTDK